MTKAWQRTAQSVEQLALSWSHGISDDIATWGAVSTELTASAAVATNRTEKSAIAALVKATRLVRKRPIDPVFA